jgi:hypothetical protein
LEHEARGTVAVGALHQRLLFHGEQWLFYVLALNDGQVFLARRQPPLYDRSARRIATREIPPGSTVRVRYNELNGLRWMDAVQIVMLVEDHAPFEPVPDTDDG